MLFRFASWMLLAAGAVALTGCAASTDETTFRSTPHQAKSVSLIDTTTGETLWAMDVPVGQKLETTIVRDPHSKGRKILTADEEPPSAMEWALYDIADDDQPVRRNTIELSGNPVRLSWTLREAGDRPSAMLRQPEAAPQQEAPATQPTPEGQDNSPWEEQADEEQ